MAEAILMPKQGQSVESCIITQWYKKKGDAVKAGDMLFSYETDKASFDEEAKTSGILLEVYYAEGDEVPVLSNVAVIGNAGEDISSFALATTAAESSKPAEKTAPVEEARQSVVTKSSAPVESVSIKVSPRARNMARQMGINLSQIAGTGPNGRIIARDILSGKPESQVAKARPSDTQKNVFEKGSVLIPHSNVRKIIARGMHASLQNSAQLTHHLSADARKLLALRKELKKHAAVGGSGDITLNDMICYSVTRVLMKMPEVNAHYYEEGVRRFESVHLGLAVDTERGLMVPVLKNAGDYTLKGLSSQLKQLADKCRTGKIDPELLQPAAGTFTISNLGALDIEMFTPVLNLPQIGILGVNTITYRPADLGDGTIGFIPVIGLSLTYDHRALDGAPASRFLKELKTFIGNFNIDPDL
jgi:pyruvate dehydrogenase E2 component (dihydrolipoamide acetyltransferase)